jgi:hypothetical protein
MGALVALLAEGMNLALAALLVGLANVGGGVALFAFASRSNEADKRPDVVGGEVAPQPTAAQVVSPGAVVPAQGPDVSAQSSNKPSRNGESLVPSARNGR